MIAAAETPTTNPDVCQPQSVRGVRYNTLYNYRLYSYGLYSYEPYSTDYSYGLHNYGLYGYGL